jgi:hypothetical protein
VGYKLKVTMSKNTGCYNKVAVSTILVLQHEKMDTLFVYLLVASSYFVSESVVP